MALAAYVARFRVLGPGHPNSLGSLEDLATDLADMGRLQVLHLYYCRRAVCCTPADVALLWAPSVCMDVCLSPQVTRQNIAACTACLIMPLPVLAFIAD